MATRSAVLLVFPGAGADRDHSALRSLDATVSGLVAGGRRWSCVRADFPYRRAGRRAPDKPPVLMQAVRDELSAIGARRDVVVGGRSMGGRICSMVAAGADGAPPPRRLVGVVTISYPLHPPGRPDRLRVEHLAAVTVPWLFVHGTKDPFGSREELERWSATAGGPVTHHWIEDNGHDLKGADDMVSAAVGSWLAALAP